MGARLAKASGFCSRLIRVVMHLRVSRYGVSIALLSLASAVCLIALAARYASVDSQYLSFMSYASLTLPSLVCAGFWVWWKNPIFRAAGYCIGSLLLAFCARSLAVGPVGGDMDFGATFTAFIATIGCFALSVVACGVAGVLSLLWPRVHNKPLQPITRADARSG